MASALPLTEQEAALVKVALDFWVEGLADAKDATISDDRTLDTVEKLLDATDGLDDQERLLRGVRERMDQIWKYSNV